MQFGLFGEAEDLDEVTLEECEPWPQREELRREKDALGFFLTGHPLEKYKNVLSMMSSASSKDIKSSMNGKEAVFGGLVITIKQIMDKKQNPMAFVTIEDNEGQAEVILFSDVLEKTRQHVHEDGVVLLRGKISNRNGGEGKLLVNTVTPVGEDHFPKSKEVHFTLELETLGEEKVNELKTMLAAHVGDAKIYFHLKEGGRRTHVIKVKSHGVKLDYDLVALLSATLGPENIRLIPSTGS